MKELSFFIEIEPMGCPRPRVSMSRVTYPDKYIQHRRALGWLLAAQHVPQGLSVDKIKLEFLFSYPKGVKLVDRVNGAPYLKTPDVDNLAKSVLDALTMSGIIKDDALVHDLHATKRYTTSSTGIVFTLIYP